VDESFFGPARVRGRPGPRKRGRAHSSNRCLASTSAMARCTRNWCLTARPKRYSQLSEAKYFLTALYIRTAGGGMMAWLTLASINTFGSTNPSALPKKVFILTALKPFGVLPSAAYQSSTGSRETSNFTSKSANGATTKLCPSSLPT